MSYLLTIKYDLLFLNHNNTNVSLIFCFLSSIVPGGRDVFAEVIRVSTPNNFFPCQLALAASIGLFHGILLRRVTGGQLPVVILSMFLYSISYKIYIAALSQVLAAGKEPRKVRGGTADHEVCVQLEQVQDVLPLEHTDYQEEDVLYHHAVVLRRRKR